MKKILIVFSVFLLNLCLPVSVNAAQWVDGLCIKAVDGYAEIIDASPDLEGDIVIPDYYGGYGIEYIGVEAFKDCTGITSITLGENIGGIYYNAFAGCTNLTTVNFNCKSYSQKDSAGSPDRPVFADCPNLTTVNIGKNVESIPKYLFYGVSSLKTVNFAGDMPKIGQDAFKGCAYSPETETPVSSSPAASKPTATVTPSSQVDTPSSKVDAPSSEPTDTNTVGPDSSSKPASSNNTNNNDSTTTIIIIAVVAGVLVLGLGIAAFLLFRSSKDDDKKENDA
ncbi:MAG: leucine-rich repeat domain-containing protein [Ruminococcaceae bacterium]|nr:leucine-rich repeat domain-containing protein [Oscillospiraceae bacterium]